MIRFACPGCSATFTVEDEKAGKAGRCPKCQTQFVIPSSDASGTTAQTASGGNAAASAPSSTVEIEPCPKCQTRLSVSPTDIGLDVECPYCQTVFRARQGSAKAPEPPPPPKRKSSFEFDEDRPSRRRRDEDDDDDDDRPRNRRRRVDDDDDDRPSRRRRRDDDDDDDEDERPSRRRKRRKRYDQECKKVTAGVLALLLGGWGIHKFYLGYHGAGVIQLILTIITCGIAGIIPFVEGIIYLIKTDEEFIETYQIGTKEWF